MSQTIPTGTTTKVQPRLVDSTYFTIHRTFVSNSCFKSLAKVVKMDHEVGDSRRVNRVHRTVHSGSAPLRGARRATLIPILYLILFVAVAPCGGCARESPVCVYRLPLCRSTGTGKQTPGGAGTHTGHTDRRTSQPSQPTTHPRETARRPNQRPTQVRPQPRSRPLPAADSEERPPPANPTQPPPAPPGGAGDTNLTKHLNNHEPHRLTRQTGTGRSSELRKVA
jgi:hypothetical protein